MGCGSCDAHSAEISIRATRTREVLGEKNCWSSRLLCTSDSNSQSTAWSFCGEDRGSYESRDGAGRRLCCDVVRFNLETWLEGLRGDDQWKKWPQRALCSDRNLGCFYTKPRYAPVATIAMDSRLVAGATVNSVRRWMSASRDTQRECRATLRGSVARHSERCFPTGIRVSCRCGQFCEVCTCMGASAYSNLLGCEVHGRGHVAR